MKDVRKPSSILKLLYGEPYERKQLTRVYFTRDNGGFNERQYPARNIYKWAYLSWAITVVVVTEVLVRCGKCGT